MGMTTSEQPTYYRTARGSHRHTRWTCANVRRSIQMGPVTEIPAAEVADWAPCDVCCGATEVTEHAARTAAATAEKCPNPGVVKPRHIESECRACGKRGKVNRSTGKIAAHKPAR